MDALPESSPNALIEVLSPDDSCAELMSRFADYANMGVPHIWLVDPIARRFSIYREGSLIASPRLELPQHSVVIELSDIFPTLSLEHAASELLSEGYRFGWTFAVEDDPR